MLTCGCGCWWRHMSKARPGRLQPVSLSAFLVRQSTVSTAARDVFDCYCTWFIKDCTSYDYFFGLAICLFSGLVKCSHARFAILIAIGLSVRIDVGECDSHWSKSRQQVWNGRLELHKRDQRKDKQRHPTLANRNMHSSKIELSWNVKQPVKIVRRVYTTCADRCDHWLHHTAPCRACILHEGVSMLVW